MGKHAPLDRKLHRHMKVVTERGARYGDDVRMVPVVPSEFQNLVVDYPIFFTKEGETGGFVCAAILGFDEKENLFLDGTGWTSVYIPLNIQRYPFFASPTDKGADIFVDLESARVQYERGEALFDEAGAPSSYLQRIASILTELANGFDAAKAFIAFMLELDLIEPARLEITFANGERKNLEGLYTINQDKLRDLPAESVADMHKRGYLQLAHTMICSLEHIRSLIERKNARLMSAAPHR